MGQAGYRLLPDVALADIAYHAWAPSLEGLFEACARALTDVMVDRKTLRSRLKKTVRLEATDSDGLLYDFLTELIVMKDVDSLLFKTFKVELTGRGRRLACQMGGEAIDRMRHGLRNDVKAVTMHMFGIARTDGAWSATVVLDI